MAKFLTFVLAASSLLAAPAAAAGSYEDTTIGKWMINGADGACSAGAGYGGAHVIFVSADGENEGILFLAGKSVIDGIGDGASLRLTIDDDAVQGEGSVSDDPPGYYVSYSMNSQMPLLGNNPRLVLTKSGKPIVDVTLTDVRRVIAELRRCDAVVS